MQKKLENIYDETIDSCGLEIEDEEGLVLPSYNSKIENE